MGQYARLEFSHVAGRTQLIRRQFGWPFHVGRQLQELDAPELAVVVLQSASGTLNAGDRTRTSLVVNERASARVRAQGAPSVHRPRGGVGAHEETEIVVGNYGYLEYLPEPRVLFPHSRFSQATTIDLEGDSCVLFIDGVVAIHGDSGQGFDEYSSELTIRRDGKLAVHECMRTGDWSGMPGRVRSFTAFGLVLLLMRPGEPLPQVGREWSDETRYVSGSVLPNQAGLMVRVAAISGMHLRNCVDEMVTHCRSAGIIQSR